MTSTGETLLADVMTNRSLLRGCERHLFKHSPYRIGQRIPCDNCGGLMRGPEIANYIQGYEAAGGGADDIWPNYRTRKGA